MARKRSRRENHNLRVNFSTWTTRHLSHLFIYFQTSSNYKMVSGWEWDCPCPFRRVEGALRRSRPRGSNSNTGWARYYYLHSKVSHGALSQKELFSSLHYHLMSRDRGWNIRWNIVLSLTILPFTFIVLTGLILVTMFWSCNASNHYEQYQQSLRLILELTLHLVISNFISY
jgi:hypothetical protein